MNNMNILNIGCGNKKMDGAINIDIYKFDSVDFVFDCNNKIWPWETNSIDGIYASHVIEHIEDHKSFILECHRILKRGGFLYLRVPHSSSASAIGCIGHFRTYSYNTMKDYLSRDFYLFGNKKFNTVEQRLNWWYEDSDNMVMSIFSKILNPIVNICPELCENLWCYWVGGCKEVIWKGIKI